MTYKKIAHVQVIPHLTGVQQVSIDVLGGLSDEYEKYIIFGGSYEVKQSLIELLEENGIRVLFVPSLKREIGLHDITSVTELIRLFREYNFDIIHTNSTKPGIVARFAARVSGCPRIIHSVHGIAYHKFEPFIKRCLYFTIETFFSFFSDKLVSVNKYYLKYYPFVKSKQYIYNSVQPEQFQVIEKSYSKKLRFGFMGRLDRQKDPITLLKAIKHGRDNGYFSSEDMCLIVGGEGELSDDCRKFVIDNNLESYVSFVGWVSDKNKFYNSIDVFCLTSIYEAFGLVFLEAACFNIPSIATKVEGIPEVVLDNETGFLSEPRNYADISLKINNYIANRELVLEHGLSARRYAETKFSKTSMLKKYKAIYED